MTGEAVVLLHGLGRTRFSMHGMERALRAAGYTTHSLTYPSRSGTLAELAAGIGRRIAPLWEQADRVHFVTHSMGGLVAAQLLDGGPTRPPANRIGRVVMLAPPLRGSEMADALSALPPYRWLMGPAAMELTTTARQSPPPPSYELGIIAGTIGWAYPLGSLLLPRPHDGRVALARTRIPGISGHIAVRGMHGLLMNREDVQRQTIAFLATGRFTAETG